VKVVVAGAGVIGLWCARSLAASGAEVTVFAPTATAAASTPASAGWVVPVLSAPLSGPGLVRHSAAQLLRGQAAFSFTGMSPRLARWLVSFVRSGSDLRYRHGLSATLELAASAPAAYHALRTDGLDFELHHDGLLMVARTPGGLHEASALVDGAADAGYPGKSDHLDAGALTELEPALTDGLAGGVHSRDELHVHPGQLVDALRTDVEARGVRLRAGAVRAVVPASGGRWSVLTSEGRITADNVVVAAGYWSREVIASLGVRLPLESAAGFSITAVGPRPPLLPLKLVEANVAVTPFDGGVRLAGRFALGPPPRRVSQRQLRRVVSVAAPYFRAWRPEGVFATHVGLRPATPDSMPVIGALPGHSGVYAATGHGMLGLTLAPGTAAEIHHQIATGAPTEIGAAFAVDRFAQARAGTARARSSDIGS
jgi:D-amino-acid dehydrogenase